MEGINYAELIDNPFSQFLALLLARYDAEEIGNLFGTFYLYFLSSFLRKRDYRRKKII